MGSEPLPTLYKSGEGCIEVGVGARVHDEEDALRNVGLGSLAEIEPLLTPESGRFCHPTGKSALGHKATSCVRHER